MKSAPRFLITLIASLLCLYVYANEEQNNQFELKKSDQLSLDNYKKNIPILDRTPDYFWDENKPIFYWNVPGKNTPSLISKGGFRARGSAGMIPYYTGVDNQIYVLLSRESWGVDRNTYCDLGGAVEIYDQYDTLNVDTFLTTLLKEAAEESGHLYTVDREMLLSNSYVLSYRHENTGFYKDFESILVGKVAKRYYINYSFNYFGE